MPFFDLDELSGKHASEMQLLLRRVQVTNIAEGFAFENIVSLLDEIGVGRGEKTGPIEIERISKRHGTSSRRDQSNHEVQSKTADPCSDLREKAGITTDQRATHDRNRWSNQWSPWKDEIGTRSPRKHSNTIDDHSNVIHLFTIDSLRSKRKTTRSERCKISSN